MARKAKPKPAGTVNWPVNILAMPEEMIPAIKIMAIERGLLFGELIRDWIVAAAKKQKNS